MFKFMSTNFVQVPRGRDLFVQGWGSFEVSAAMAASSWKDQLKQSALALRIERKFYILDLNSCSVDVES